MTDTKRRKRQQLAKYLNHEDTRPRMAILQGEEGDEDTTEIAASKDASHLVKMSYMTTPVDDADGLEKEKNQAIVQIGRAAQTKEERITTRRVRRKQP